ncbi:hypothetical protein [Lonsdalea quercina]|uniref:hypothetical protein n=1 Tax=Lonsdalea quercina TaxID=71657 RepID=UPI003974BD44
MYRHTFAQLMQVDFFHSGQNLKTLQSDEREQRRTLRDLQTRLGDYRFAAIGCRRPYITPANGALMICRSLCALTAW